MHKQKNIEAHIAKTDDTEIASQAWVELLVVTEASGESVERSGQKATGVAKES